MYVHITYYIFINIYINNFYQKKGAEGGGGGEEQLHFAAICAKNSLNPKSSALSFSLNEIVIYFFKLFEIQAGCDFFDTKFF